MRSKKDSILIITLIILLVISIGLIIYLLLSRNNKNDIVNYKEINGVVIVAFKDYVIIESEEGDYLINNIKGLYEVGDEVKFQYKETDIDDTSSPKTIKACDEELIKKMQKKDNT